MKYSFFINRTIAAVLLIILGVSSCTKKFEEYNTDPTGVTEELLQTDFNSIGAFYASMQNPFASAIPYEVGELGMGGTWGGYFMSIYPGPESVNYYLYGGTYSLFNEGYNNTMAPVAEIARRGARTDVPDFWAVALVLKVAAMQRVTDIYGPITYSQYGSGGTTVGYDSQKDVYSAFFSELDTAVSNLKAYIASYPGATPFSKFDKLYSGDYTKWLKFANSLRLRLAMQVVKIDAEKAAAEALKAMDASNGGVFTSNEDNAFGGASGLWVPAHDWADYRAGAAIVTYMNGYSDPRRAQYFELSTVSPGKYAGVRQGATGVVHDPYAGFSDVSLTNYTSSSKNEWMTTAEVYFLRAEGALRGWDMGGTPQALYEAGIANSFDRWGLGGSSAAYIADGTSVPENYVDPLTAENNIAAMSTVTVKWDESDTPERKLEKIITQKFIAVFPDGTLAWDNYRRTGYPKLFPVVINNSAGVINSNTQVRRMIYPDTEVAANGAEVAKAIILLGGPDNGATRLWWDLNQSNF